MHRIDIAFSMEDTPIARQLKSGDRFFRGKTVRLLSETNEQLGLMSFEDALNRAAAAGLDLVEMASKVEPPVCKIMDFGKFQYQESRRQREAKKKQVQAKVKEVKLHPNIDENDLSIKVKHGLEFLEKGDKVKVIVTFRGREMAHTEIGDELMKRVLESLSERSVIDAAPKLMGRNIIAVLAPKGGQSAKAGGNAPKGGSATANSDDE